MTQNDLYLYNVVQRHKLPDQIDEYTSSFIVSPLKTIISNWANQYLVEIKLSGSRAKGDAIDLSSDLDLFISLSSVTPCSLKEI